MQNTVLYLLQFCDFYFYPKDEKDNKNKLFVLMLTASWQVYSWAVPSMHWSTSSAYTYYLLHKAAWCGEREEPILRANNHSTLHISWSPYIAITLHFYNVLVEDFHSTVIKYTLAYFNLMTKVLSIQLSSALIFYLALFLFGPKGFLLLIIKGISH